MRHRVKTAETAFPHRYDHYNCGAKAGWNDHSDTERNIRWSRESWAAMQPFCERDAYVNDLGEEGEQRVRGAYGQNYERLMALKQKYDPTNFFCINQKHQTDQSATGGELVKSCRFGHRKASRVILRPSVSWREQPKRSSAWHVSRGTGPTRSVP